jgi:prolyl-tRNA synthetase
VNKIRELADQLKGKGIRVVIDDTPGHNPGFKFNQWELKGTPVRIELGSKDFAK